MKKFAALTVSSAILIALVLKDARRKLIVGDELYLKGKENFYCIAKVKSELRP